MGVAVAFLPAESDAVRADAERLAHIIMEMQRCFILRLSKELAPGHVSFPQFFLLTYLDHMEVLTMSAIAQKMDTRPRRPVASSLACKILVMLCVPTPRRIGAK